MTGKQSQKGFTIIEVVLVLAIAALIFLIVFLAVPALQRSQRDTQRRNDVGRLHTAISTYAGNHQGTPPATGDVNAAWVDKYLRVDGDKFDDPAKGAYTVNAGSASPKDPAASATYAGTGTAIMYYATSAKCDTDGTFAAAGSRNYAVSVILESRDIYCQDN